MNVRTTFPTLEGRKPRSDSPRPDGIRFTADFATTALWMVFREGGPPHFMGRHPCCFPAGRIDGVALRAGETHGRDEAGTTTSGEST